MKTHTKFVIIMLMQASVLTAQIKDPSKERVLFDKSEKYAVIYSEKKLSTVNFESNDILSVNAQELSAVAVSDDGVVASISGSAISVFGAIDTELKLLGSIALTFKPETIIIEKSYLYVGGISSEGAILAVISFSDTKNPSLLQVRTFPGKIISINTHNGFLYVSGKNQTVGFLKVYNISNSSLPINISSFSLDHPLTNPVFFANWLFVQEVSAGILIADVADPAKIRFLFHFEQFFEPNLIGFENNYLFFISKEDKSICFLKYDPVASRFIGIVGKIVLLPDQNPLFVLNGKLYFTKKDSSLSYLRVLP